MKNTNTTNNRYLYAAQVPDDYKIGNFFNGNVDEQFKPFGKSIYQKLIIINGDNDSWNGFAYNNIIDIFNRIFSTHWLDFQIGIISEADLKKKLKNYCNAICNASATEEKLEQLMKVLSLKEKFQNKKVMTTEYLVSRLLTITTGVSYGFMEISNEPFITNNDIELKRKKPEYATLYFPEEDMDFSSVDIEAEYFNEGEQWKIYVSDEKLERVSVNDLNYLKCVDRCYYTSKMYLSKVAKNMAIEYEVPEENVTLLKCSEVPKKYIYEVC